MAIGTFLSSIAGAAISAGASMYGVKKHNEAQRRESELAYQRERQSIAEQNAYNSTSAQMARLSAAGLNPNMIYDNGQQAAAGTQEDIPRYQPAEMDNAFEPAANAGASIIQSMIGLKDIANKTAMNVSQIALNASTENFQSAQSRQADATAKRMLDLLGWEISEKDANIKFTSQQIDNLKAERERILADTALIAKKSNLTDKEIDNLDATTKLILFKLPYAEEFAKMEVAEKRAVISKIAREVTYMDESISIQNFNKWVNLGDVIARNVVNAAGVASRFLGKGASIEQVFGQDPWSMMNGKGAFTKGFNLNDSENPFGQFLAGD